MKSTSSMSHEQQQSLDQTNVLLRRVQPNAIQQQARRDAVDGATLQQASVIVESVRNEGEVALRRYATQFGDLAAGVPLVLERAHLQSALQQLPMHERRLLERTAERIRAFAHAQRRCLTDLACAVPGGEAGHTIAPMERAGCYAPGGRFPLPSSVLMTAVTARVAGVECVWVASPRPTLHTLAAAAIADADAVLCVGGAHAIAALAYGAGPVPACDVIVGPGNKWVTAAKQLVSGHVAIDMLAGPSELLIVAEVSTEMSADPDMVAADLLAQAEHDVDAVPALVVIAQAPVADAFLAEVERALQTQLAALPTRSTAEAALRNGFCVVCKDRDQAMSVSNTIAAEHVELLVSDPQSMAQKLRHYGAVFVGTGAAEVLGDYGAGPNHVLPTGQGGRHTGGLSVFDFLRIRTWLRIDDLSAAQILVEDAELLARLEGLEGHARSATQRRIRDK